MNNLTCYGDFCRTKAKHFGRILKSNDILVLTFQYRCALTKRIFPFLKIFLNH